MEITTQRIIKNRIVAQKRGKVIFPADLSEYGNVEAVKKTLLRLEEKGFLLRLAHGIYLYPKKDPILGMLYPSLDEIAQVIAKRDKARIMPTGIYALNRLGFSTQVPMRVVYLTDGTARSIKVGKGSIEFKRTSPKNLAIKNEMNGLIIQALRAIGKDNVTEQQIGKVQELLANTDPDIIRRDGFLAPAWIREIMFATLINKQAA